MAYASASDVSALTRDLIGSASGFDTGTCPTLTQVNAWLSTGCAVINATIGGYGYGAIPESSAAYGLAQQANALYAAWMAERSRSSARISTQERTRAEMFRSDYKMLMETLSDLNLGRMGVTQTSQVVAGGISQSDKDRVAADSDRVPDRFSRGMFRNQDTLTPGTG